ncbi:hypothetical protein Pint_18660 [Pistacia integerrima]|uniref:Uncharacterized protein n=1 Tax=Pistacia integerrima TaxID=434235 RepID=A0ACC0Z090_9ROSI|nr:hypothetical protein Pint_18660 [Pistacia integerrima]
MEYFQAKCFTSIQRKKAIQYLQTNLREKTHGEDETVESHYCNEEVNNAEEEVEHEQPIEEEQQHQESGQNGEHEQPIEEEQHQGTARSSGLGDGLDFVSWNVSDPEVLDCSVCCEPLTIPVYQCKNGHIACESCCKGMSRCAYCSSIIGYDRCRAIEKVLECVEIKCQNVEYGCQERMNYSKKRDHENNCRHVPCSCPLPDCNFIGTVINLYRHCSLRHQEAVQFTYNRIIHITLHIEQKFVVLKEERRGDVFILNNRAERNRIGNAISVRHIAPTWKQQIFYSILTKSGGSHLRFQSSTENIQKLSDNPPLIDEFLIPVSSFGYYRQLKLDIRIGR